MSKTIITINGDDPYTVLSGEAIVIDWDELRDPDCDPDLFFVAFDALEPDFSEFADQVLELADRHPRMAYAWAVPTMAGVGEKVATAIDRAAAYEATLALSSPAQGPGLELHLVEVDGPLPCVAIDYRNLGTSVFKAQALAR